MPNPTFRKLTAILVLVLTLVLSACGSSGGGNGGASGKPEDGASTAPAGSPAPSGGSASPSGENIELTVAITANEPFFDLLKQQFEASHPGITVNFKEYIGAPGDKAAAGAAAQMQRDLDKFVSTVTTELASGKGPDLLLTNYLPYKKYADKHLLADIGEMMNNDPDFNMDDYYTNVFDAMKYNGQYVTIPTSVQFTNLWVGDRSALGDGDIGDKTWDWPAFAEKMKSAVPAGGSALGGVTADTLFQTMLNPGIERFVDQAGKKATFDSQPFIDLLNEAKQMVDDGLVSADSGKNLNLFMSYPIRYLSDFTTIPQVMFKSGGGVYRAPGSSPGYAFRSNLTLSINDKSPNKQAAWEFLKFVLSDDIQATSSRSGMRGVPVNKNAFHQLQEALKDSAADNGAVTKQGEGGESFTLKPPSDEEIAGLESYMTGITVAQETDDQLVGLVLGETGPFFSGQKTAEETAAAIQQKVNLYLNE